jgi:hypothetical protein
LTPEEFEARILSNLTHKEVALTRGGTLGSEIGGHETHRGAHLNSE